MRNIMINIMFIMLLFNPKHKVCLQEYVLDFDGVNDFIQLDDNIGDNIRSIELWFNPNETITPQSEEPKSLFVRNSVNEDGEFGLCLSKFDNYEGSLLFYRRIGHDFYYVLSDNDTWDQHVWYHVAATIDPVAGMKLYINGVLQEMVSPNPQPTDERDELITIGKWGDMDFRYWDGRLDEIRIWTRSLTEDEIVKNMCSLSDPSVEIGLKAYWKCDEGEGNIIMDHSGNQNHGLKVGAGYLPEGICTATSAKKAPNRTGIKLYPNPAEEEIKIWLDQEDDPYELSIYNNTGQLVMFKTGLSTLEYSINTKNYPSGIYFLTLRSNRGTQSKIFIVE